MIEYVPGKQAWYEENQPREGQAVDEIWIGDVADSEVPTCDPADRIGDVRARTAGWDTCVVVNSERVVMGLLRKKELDGDSTATAGQVMRLGPSTFRPSMTLQDLLRSMRDHDIQTNSLVTTLDGRLLGVISRADAEATMAHESSAEVAS
ncbi:MAG TPA: CBS domain-containing protein [Candidatus Dormibacteraeota bacterium]|nr:CBS domain-containing protein [Candidatus Dormibacteraeota bacterium]